MHLGFDVPMINDYLNLIKNSNILLMSYFLENHYIKISARYTSNYVFYFYQQYLKDIDLFKLKLQQLRILEGIIFFNQYFNNKNISSFTLLYQIDLLKSDLKYLAYKLRTWERSVNQTIEKDYYKSSKEWYSIEFNHY